MYATCSNHCSPQCAPNSVHPTVCSNHVLFLATLQTGPVNNTARVTLASFLQCNLANRRSIAVLCMLSKMNHNPMHPVSGALPLPYVPVRVTRGTGCSLAFVLPPRYRASQYRITFVPVSVSLWNDFNDPVFDGVRLAGFKSRAYEFLLDLFALSFCLLLFFIFVTYAGWFCWVGVFGLIVFSLSLRLHC